MTGSRDEVRPADLDGLLTWREASTSGAAIEAALGAARSAPRELDTLLDGAERIILAGAGSSYYLARVAAAVEIGRASCRERV
jgi:fructoselysine-6-P-deglycase FrlB-like protein